MMSKKITYFLLVTMFLSTSSLYAQKNQIVAHRGAWKKSNLPQNSRASLKEAIKLKCYGSEFDVQLTKDNILVLNHDSDIQGMDIATNNYEDLLKLKLKNGETIPTAEEILKIGKKQKKTKLIYEIKSSKLGYDRTVKTVKLSVDLVKKLKVENLVEFILFDYKAAKALIEIYPEAKVYSLSPFDPNKVKADGFYGVDFNYNVYKTKPEYFNKSRELGLKINTWTVNQENTLKDAIEMDFDFITTDEPELLHKLLKAKSK